MFSVAQHEAVSWEDHGLVATFTPLSSSFDSRSTYRPDRSSDTDIEGSRSKALLMTYPAMVSAAARVALRSLGSFFIGANDPKPIHGSHLLRSIR